MRFKVHHSKHEHDLRRHRWLWIEEWWVSKDPWYRSL